MHCPLVQYNTISFNGTKTPPADTDATEDYTWKKNLSSVYRIRAKICTVRLDTGHVATLSMNGW